jgi:hypothetical protein
MSKFMTIRPVGAELFHAEGQKDKQVKANSRVRNFVKPLKTYTSIDSDISILYFNLS